MVVVSKKNEAMNNVIIVHQDGGSEPDNRTAHQYDVPESASHSITT